MRVFLVLVLLGCNGGHPLGDGGLESDGEPAASDGSGGTGGSGGSGGADGGCSSGTPLQVCYPTCTSPANCSATSTGAFSVSHYTCDGVCRYQGCNSDPECQESLGGNGKTWRCAAMACQSIRFCQQACASAADCAAETTAGGAYGVDNYACENGVCRYTGCTSDSECQTSLGASGHTYRCRSRFCQQSCTQPADCAMSSGGAYGADRYACDQNACRWLGCNSDASCQQSFMGRNYACR